jgi:DNA-binding transcriptional MerR regulator
MPQASSTLQHVTKRKLEKLCEHITKFEAKKRATLDDASTRKVLREQVEVLLEGAKKNGLILDKDNVGINVKQIKRYLDQAEHDPSISGKQITSWRSAITREIDIQERKLVYAKLFGNLCTEWAQKPNKSPTRDDASNSEDMDVDDEVDSSASSFISVANLESAKEQRADWESYAFTAVPKDQEAIDAYLKTLFEFTRKSNKITKSPLHQLQLAMGRFEDAEPKRFSGSVVEDCINGLLRADFFSNAKRQEASEMRDNPEILSEVADVLNMDLDAIETWDWEGPVALHQRRMLNGKFRVFYDEEVHQAIFLQFIGMKWAILMKKAFEVFFHSGSWTQAPFQAMDKLSRQRRDYFLGDKNIFKGSVRDTRRDMYQRQFFMLQLPSDMRNSHSDYDDHDHGPAHVPHRGDSKHPGQKKDLLHRLATTEMLVQTAVYGKCTILQSDFKWFGPSIPHDTVFAVLKFLGVKGKWLGFFRKFLQAPVYWAAEDESSDASASAIQRKRGVPNTHVLSDALTEAILFCLDFAVSKATNGADLYRFHDDLWFWGQEEVVVKAWDTIKDFSTMMGLELNLEKTACVQIFDDDTEAHELPASLPAGDVTFGLLKLDPTLKQWAVDEAKVHKHIKEIDRQLRACDSVLAWVQAWNSYACYFMSANLGHPAECFGTAHIDATLKIFSSIQEELFGRGSNAHEHLRAMIADSKRSLCDPNFDPNDIPDAFFYFPLSVGGLELQNPFVRLSAMRPDFPQDPHRLIQQAFEKDEESYAAAKKRYEDGDWRPPQTSRGNTYIPAQEEEFFSLEEYTRFREECSSHLALAYDDLLEVTEMNHVEGTAAVRDAVDAVPGGMRWRDLDVYEKWLYELYGKEMIDELGGVALGEKSMLPLGMVESLKSERTRWVS